MVGTILMAAGCTSVSKDPKNWQSMSRAERQSTLDRIADGCKLSRTAFSLTTGDEYNFLPPNDATYSSVDCSLKKLKIVGVPRMGFVGNEAYQNETEQK